MTTYRWGMGHVAAMVGIAALAVEMARAQLPPGATAQEQFGSLVANIVPSGAARAAGGLARNESILASFTAAGVARHVGAPAGLAFAGGAAKAGQPGVTARNFLKNHGALLGAAHPAIDFTTLRAKAKRGGTHVRLQQTYAGIPIFAAQANVQVTAQEDIEYAIADLAHDAVPLGLVPLVPLLTADAAAARARLHYAFDAGPHPITTTAPTLMLFVPAVLDEPGEARLVWEMNVDTPADPTRVAHHVLVDARTGQIVRGWSLSCTALNRAIYDLVNNSNNSPVLRRSEGQAASGIAEVDNAYAFVGNIYNFYSSRHSRDSYDDAGAQIQATVRWCSVNCTCPCANAFSGNANNVNSGMVFGSGWATDDIIGHEYTHRVTQLESGLIYTNQSGAMNESFSDVWGEFSDLSYAGGTDTAGVRWDMGEDLPGGRIRDMQTPPNGNDPDRVGSPLYQPPSNPSDNGGVHRNSGVNNKLCYLLTDGDTFNGQTVYGMGINQVAALYYEAQTDLLFPAAGWNDLADALRQAAVNNNWSSVDQNNLYRACLAVEIAGGAQSYYVDKTSGCPVQGGTLCVSIVGPWKTVALGASQIPVGNTLMIHGGNYNEALTIQKTMTIRSYSGTAVIGVP